MRVSIILESDLAGPAPGLTSLGLKSALRVACVSVETRAGTLCFGGVLERTSTLDQVLLIESFLEEATVALVIFRRFWLVVILNDAFRRPILPAL